ncbi:MAG TPA: RHS repeat-associated core domain-containing protein [Saprospiraceae bacterium]|nr:RHS repeat-associated core domain-containing protein [Saprospiraceae bacterium]
MMVREIEDHSESMAEQKLGGYSSRYRFTGKELDPLTGLYYFGARYYDPRISLWYGIDPVKKTNQQDSHHE